jgi:hypothetical protein
MLNNTQVTCRDGSHALLTALLSISETSQCSLGYGIFAHAGVLFSRYAGLFAL